MWSTRKKFKIRVYFEFYEHIEKCNADGVLKCLQRQNEAAEAGNTWICM